MHLTRLKLSYTKVAIPTQLRLQPVGKHWFTGLTDTLGPRRADKEMHVGALSYFNFS